MAERREYEQRYSALRESLGNFLRHNSGFSVSAASLMGSRRTGIHRDESDMDIIFTIQGDPPKTAVYPKLIEKLEQVVKVHAEPGTSYNVVKIKDGPLKVDLVLKTEEEYRKQLHEQRYEDL